MHIYTSSFENFLGGYIPGPLFSKGRVGRIRQGENGRKVNGKVGKVGVRKWRWEEGRRGEGGDGRRGWEDGRTGELGRKERDRRREKARGGNTTSASPSKILDLPLAA